MESREPVVSNVFVGALARRPIVSIDVPVISNGSALYSLDMSFGPERFRDMLGDQRLPEGWFAYAPLGPEQTDLRSDLGGEAQGGKRSGKGAEEVDRSRGALEPSRAPTRGKRTSSGAATRR